MRPTIARPRGRHRVPGEGVLIGPGHLVLVVGPSGAGKDTLIGLARARCRADAAVVFPRRLVTRPATPAEDHASISVAEFDQAVRDGRLAIWWEAHGLRYGIPAGIDADLRAGRTVVCNVSRTVVGALRARYARVTAVLVTAPEPLLAARLAARRRASDGRPADRLGRQVPGGFDLRPDALIDNAGTAEAGALRLLSLIRMQPPGPSS
jgi:ribose 1,5-bisphosphokinase